MDAWSEMEDDDQWTENKNHTVIVVKKMPDGTDLRRATCIPRAKLLGNLMLVLTINEGPISRYCLYHSLSGYLIGKWRLLRDAKSVAETLNTHCPAALAEKTKDLVLESLPIEIEEWLRRCIEDGKYYPYDVGEEDD